MDARSTMAQPSSSQSSGVFKSLQAYPFHTDPEFANGLAIILGHPSTPATEAEMNREDDLVLQAKCFFYSRKEKLSPPVDFAAFKSWLASRSTGEVQHPNAATGSPQGPREQPSEPNVPSTEASSTPPEPAYPSSFAHIVELITTGQPVPGIQQIPDTVLTGHEITSEKPRRRKPWEKDNPAPAAEETASDSR